VEDDIEEDSGCCSWAVLVQSAARVDERSVSRERRGVRRRGRLMRRERERGRRVLLKEILFWLLAWGE